MPGFNLMSAASGWQEFEMGFLRLLCLSLAGATVMVLCLLWVSQFFTGDREGTPVIWLESLSGDGAPKDEESFAEWQD